MKVYTLIFKRGQNTESSDSHYIFKYPFQKRELKFNSLKRKESSSCRKTRKSLWWLCVCCPLLTLANHCLNVVAVYCHRGQCPNMFVLGPLP